MITFNFCDERYGEDESEMGVGYSIFEFPEKVMPECLMLNGDNINEEFQEGRTGNADAAIALMCYLQEKEIDCEIDYWGAPFWAYHDLMHAENDAVMTLFDGSTAEIDFEVYHGDAEDNAHIYGARKALNEGVALYDIVRELIKAEPEFKRRFNYESTALQMFLNEITASV